MPSPRTESASSEWTSANGDLHLQWDPAVLDTIRGIVVDGYYRLPHGGLEIGGVLFGTTSGSAVSIQAFAQFPLTHAYGPGFQITPEDRKAVERAIEARPEIDGTILKPVGWFRSRNRSGIELDDKDLAIFRDYFREPLQVALVFKPVRYEPTRLGIFYRDPDGTISPEPLGEVLTLMPLKRSRGAAAGDLGVIDEPGPEPALETPAPVPDTRNRSSRARTVKLHEILDGTADTEQQGSPGLRLEKEAPEMPAAAPETAPSPVQYIEPVPPPGRPVWHWLLAAVLLLCLLAGGVYSLLHWQEISLAVGSFFEERIGLRVMENGGQLEIAWNRVSGIIEQATTGRLMIRDGGVETALELDQAQLRNGSVTYQRISDDVFVRLVVERPGKPAEEEIARFFKGSGRPLETAGVDSTAVPFASAPEPMNSAASLEEPEARDAVPEPPKNQPAAAPGQPPPSTPRESRALLSSAANDRQSQTRRQPPPQPAEVKPAAAKPALPNPAAVKPTAAAAAPVKPFVTPEQTPAPAKPIVITQTLAPPPLETVTQAPAQPAKAVVNAPPPPAPKPSGPAAGRAIWTGQLSRGANLIIDKGKASTGFLTGNLPDAPLRVSVQPAQLAEGGIIVYSANPRYASGPVEEPPSQRNGWNKTTYRYDPKRVQEVQVVEPPSPQNGNRLVLRTSSRPVAVLLIDWQRAE